jgi:L-lactate dehydrogenase complex protein LldG
VNGHESARSAILARVRRAQQTAVLPGSAEVEGPDARPVAETTETHDRFVRELGMIGVQVRQADTVESVRGMLGELLAGHAVLSWAAASLPYDVGETLRGATPGSATRDLQAAATIGVTGCDAAVAETGSLVLLSGPGRERTVSLLPPAHVALVSRRSIVPALADAFAALDEPLRHAACATVITGPSRTADIELTLTLGIHGPGTLIVVIGP